MKKTNFLRMVLFSIFVVSACSPDDPALERPSNNLLEMEPEIYDFLNCEGFDLKDAQLNDKYISLEKDILLSVDEIKMAISAKHDRSNGRTEQYVLSTSGVVSFANVLGINYFIAPSVTGIPGDWPNAIRTGLQSWENLANSRIDFTEVFTAGEAEVIFRADNDLALPACARNLDSDTYAVAMFPAGSQPGMFISINDIDVSDNQANRESVIRHEMGHALGFRHDNAPSEGSGTTDCGQTVGFNLLAGTPSSESSSIMFPSLNSGDSKNLSTNDALAAQFLYPTGYTWATINSLTQYYRTSTTKDVSVTMSTPAVKMYRYRVERMAPWSSTVLQSADYTNAPNTMWLLNVPHGTWNFRITSFNYAMDATMTGTTMMATIQ